MRRAALLLPLVFAACAHPVPAALDAAVVNPPAFRVSGRSVPDVRTDVGRAMNGLGYVLVLSQPFVMFFQKSPPASLRDALLFGASRVYQVTVTVAESGSQSVAVSVSPQMVTGGGGVTTLPADEIRAVTDALSKIPGATSATP